MHVNLEGRVLELMPGDVTKQVVDAIVNAANSRLAGGGGVDGAVHRAGGPAIMEETGRRYPDGCPTGSAVVTGGGNLPARYVIHAVGPFYRDGAHGEPEQLAAAYRTSLELARDHGCDSIALPSLSTGAYRYPVAEASRIAVATALNFLRQNAQPRLVRFVLFSQDVYDAFAAALSEFTSPAGPP
jgi:O-acetyl-ADP-ribose deacetylase (regulator of RNase III)